MIELVLPWPPSVNTYWRHVPIRKGGKLFVVVKISKAGREYRKEVTRIVKESGIKTLSGALAVKQVYFCPDWRERDIDNLSKAVFDSIAEAKLIAGDKFICATINEKKHSTDGVGRVLIQIKQLSSGVTVKPAGAWLKQEKDS